jgi:D-alanyl-D-alanine carboxypeptidase/D-alanyl-D-alanine-endopeptidase (penicillin-binding protein 4)
MRKLILASLSISGAISFSAQAQTREQRIARLLDSPPFNRVTWNIYAQDDRGRVIFNRNADRLSVPASNTKLVVASAASVLLPADYRPRTSLYANGTITNGVLQGDVILYGRGDPTWWSAATRSTPWRRGL